MEGVGRLWKEGCEVTSKAKAKRMEMGMGMRVKSIGNWSKCNCAQGAGKNKYISVILTCNSFVCGMLHPNFQFLAPVKTRYVEMLNKL